MKNFLKRRRKPKTNAVVGGERVLLDLAHSVHDLVITCGCGERMRVEGDEVVCSCGNKDNASDLWYEVSILGPLKGYEVTIYPEDVGMAK